jgi:hypothetical protein
MLDLSLYYYTVLKPNGIHYNKKKLKLKLNHIYLLNKIGYIINIKKQLIGFLSH